MRKFLRQFALDMAGRYKKMSIQMVIARSFTVVAIIGMVFIVSSLVLHFSSSSSKLIMENTERVLYQANLNLDSYLRRMMRISDTMYYRVIKHADLAEDSISDSMNLLYEENRDALVSIALFNGTGDLIYSTPLSALKESAAAEQSPWFLSALDKMENLHFSAPHIQRLFNHSDNQYHWVVSLSRYVQLTYNGITKRGVLHVDINFKGIE